MLSGRQCLLQLLKGKHKGALLRAAQHAACPLDLVRAASTASQQNAIGSDQTLSRWLQLLAGGAAGIAAGSAAYCSMPQAHAEQQQKAAAGQTVSSRPLFGMPCWHCAAVYWMLIAAAVNALRCLTPPALMQTSAKPPLETITAAEVAQHNTKDKRVWVTYKEGVYDVSSPPIVKKGRHSSAMHSAMANISHHLEHHWQAQQCCPSSMAASCSCSTSKTSEAWMDPCCRLVSQQNCLQVTDWVDQHPGGGARIMLGCWRSP